MLTIEQHAESEFGLTTTMLMERAGEAVADEAKKILSSSGKALIVCGKGNNGGDGFVAARLLDEAGYAVTVYSLANADDLAPDARKAFDKLPARITIIAGSNLNTFDEAVLAADIIIDAIFGFSLKGAVRGTAADIIDRVNASQRPILSVDLPSGLAADTGKVYSSGIVADVTVTFTAPKVGMLLYSGFVNTGEYIVADIGIPGELVEEIGTYRELDKLEVRNLFPVRDINAHKKSVGQVLVIAGSRGMPGAAALVARAAYRMGAGLVAFAPPAGITAVLNEAVVEAIAWPQHETAHGTLALAADEHLLAIASQYDVVAIGPGLGSEPETEELIRMLVADIDKPMVIDASALTAIAANPNVLRNRRSETIITPHPGEMARLFGVSPQEVLGDWLGFAHRAHDEFGAVVVLKGARTVICGQVEITINTTGNPGLATAGTGDVLTGAIAALLAQGLDAYSAASIGAFLHGLSADIAVEDSNIYSLTASDVIEYLPEAINEVIL
jgi:NAD(P)H-hydrate epimerase